MKTLKFIIIILTIGFISCSENNSNEEWLNEQLYLLCDRTWNGLDQKDQRASRSYIGFENSKIIFKSDKSAEYVGNEYITYINNVTLKEENIKNPFYGIYKYEISSIESIHYLVLKIYSKSYPNGLFIMISENTYNYLEICEEPEVKYNSTIKQTTITCKRIYYLNR